MGLCIKEKVFSWSEAYDVYDENGNVKYTVKGEVFSLGHKIHIYDLEGKEVASVIEKVWSFLKNFRIFINGEEKGAIKEKFSFFHPKYNVDFLDLEVEGDIFDWNYQMTKGGTIVATMQRKVFSWASTFYLDCALKTDEVSYLALAIAIDAAHNDDEMALIASGM
ncbi:MAG: LURP-one-related family protein [Bacilli bacterium]|jgi:uncharacterized protein YxjI|nr:LURP-one-related family protein [Bacilli bacterium]